MKWVLPCVVGIWLGCRHHKVLVDLDHARTWAVQEIRRTSDAREDLIQAQELNDLLYRRCAELATRNVAMERQLRQQGTP